MPISAEMEIKMKNPVIIKSFPNGISIYLDNEIPFSELLGEVAAKFREASHFFKDASMALSFEGRELSQQEEKQLVNTISANTSLHIVCIIGKNDETNKNYVKALQKISEHQKAMDNAGQFYKGTLKDGQVIETENSIIILGDVYPGASVYSNKDILVIGGLFGQAYAGLNGEPGHYVVALEMSPEKLKIGDFKYKTSEKQSRWSIKPKVLPKIAYVVDGRVMMDAITKELLNELPI